MQQAAPRRILLDVSHTACSPLSTGIQVVVRKLAEILPRLAHNGGIQCQPVIFRGGQFWSTTADHYANAICTLESTGQDFLEAIPEFYWKALNWFCEGGSAGRLSDSKPLSDASKLSHMRAPFSVYWKWNRFKVRKFRFNQAIDIGEGDVLILPDGYWSLMEIWDAVSRARANGATLVSIVHDIICLTHPQYFPLKLRTIFQQYLRQVIENSHLVVTISETVKKQMEQLPEYCDGHIQNVPALNHFRLGADSHSTTSIARRELQTLFISDHRPYLTVATFEPRKNHTFVLDAFEQLWSRQPEAKLVLAGRVGWQCCEIIDRLRNHPQINKRLFLFHDLSDGEIGFCYKNAKAVICGSKAEGFGLPIVESQWHGTQVFASDIPVHREVGKQSCIYFDLENNRTLTDALLDWDTRQPDQLATVDPPATWEESVSELLVKTMDFFLSPPRPGSSAATALAAFGSGRTAKEIPVRSVATNKLDVVSRVS